MRLTFVAGGLLLALAACAGSPAAEEAEPPVGPVPTIRDAREIVLPMDAYLAMMRAWHVPDLAINLLGQDCMRRFGMDWPVIETTPPDSDAPPYPRRYGIFDASRAARHGYHPADETGASFTPRREREPTLDETAVWTGRGESRIGTQTVPEGGCAGEALRTLAAGAPPPPEINPERLGNEAHYRAEQDSRVTRVLAQWSECMSRRGFHYRVPRDANGDPRWQTDKATAAEIGTATADVACKLETNVVGVWYAVEMAYQKRIIEDHATQLDAVKAYNDTVIRNAAKLVSAGGRSSGG